MTTEKVRDHKRRISSLVQRIVVALEPNIEETVINDVDIVGGTIDQLTID